MTDLLETLRKEYVVYVLDHASEILDGIPETADAGIAYDITRYILGQRGFILPWESWLAKKQADIAALQSSMNASGTAGPQTSRAPDTLPEKEPAVPSGPLDATESSKWQAVLSRADDYKLRDWENVQRLLKDAGERKGRLSERLKHDLTPELKRLIIKSEGL